MALFRKLFFRKPPDGLLEISERVFGTKMVLDHRSQRGRVETILAGERETCSERGVYEMEMARVYLEDKACFYRRVGPWRPMPIHP
ncbi:hypothetical protein U1Q18_028023 [Sarracenia purpurea var. burkii]